MRLRIRATRARSRTADCDRRSAAGRRRACARAAAAGGYERGRCRSGARATANVGGCAADWRDGQSDWFPNHVDCAKTGSSLYGEATRDVGTFVYRVRATNAGHVPVTSGVCRGDVQPHHHRAEPGRQAGDREAMKKSCSLRSLGGRVRCDRAGAARCLAARPARASASRSRPACGRPTASCCASRARPTINTGCGCRSPRSRPRSSRHSC